MTIYGQGCSNHYGKYHYGTITLVPLWREADLKMAIMEGIEFENGHIGGKSYYYFTIMK